MKRFTLSIIMVSVGITVCFAQQGSNNTIYLLFDSSSGEKCKVDVEGKGYQMLNKFRKDSIENYIIFNICDEEFVFVKKETPKETLSPKQIKNINYFNIDFLINKYNNTSPKKFKHNVFENIYIVEKVKENKFVKYKVGWTDERLGWIE